MWKGVWQQLKLYTGSFARAKNIGNCLLLLTWHSLIAANSFCTVVAVMSHNKLLMGHQSLKSKIMLLHFSTWTMYFTPKYSRQCLVLLSDPLCASTVSSSVLGIPKRDSCSFANCCGQLWWCVVAVVVIVPVAVVHCTMEGRGHHSWLTPQPQKHIFSLWIAYLQFVLSSWQLLVWFSSHSCNMMWWHKTEWIHTQKRSLRSPWSSQRNNCTDPFNLVSYYYIYS